ncbi:hypothetical protein KAM364_35710 [Aeromonas caviae]|uniref:hypothetical protein n=1 Tax=Aeromonas caviae TaxID=648 RepID=UPI001CC5E045|nr:hypothetical protein [Aeromonas caviae]GJB21659.1 hypothetical protein KAM364_35710 [Aeromonas caviae]
MAGQVRSGVLALDNWDGTNLVLPRIVTTALQEAAAERVILHIPVENEHLFRFKMNADSGLRVHHFRTPQSTNSDVR